MRQAIREMWPRIRERMRGESGQSMVELGLIVPILTFLLLLLPLDFYRFIQTKMYLESAVSQGVANIHYSRPEDFTSNRIGNMIHGFIDTNYADVRNSRVEVTFHNAQVIDEGGDIRVVKGEEGTYAYQTYDSNEKSFVGPANEDENGKYEYCTIEVTLSFDFEPFTPWGGLLERTIQADCVRRVYILGTQEGGGGDGT